MAEHSYFIVDSEGELLSARRTGREILFQGNSERIERARKAAASEELVTFLPGVPPLQANLLTDEGILAALLASAPGRCRIVKVPEELLEHLHELADVRPGEIN